MYTKHVTVNQNWLSDIDGMTVKDAIAYLSNLDPDHRLNYNLEGDTHGVELSSDLIYEVPMSNAEILVKLTMDYTSKIAKLEKNVADHIKDGRQSRADTCERLLVDARQRLEHARIKYGQ